MHEAGIMAQALEMAFDAARREGARRIVAMKLRIGALSGVVPEALAFAFDVSTRGTMAEGARLEWDLVPVVCACPNGCADFEPAALVYECPECGAFSARVLRGRELDLLELEVV
jgi:hydrogenase nickel incorporation protein HypA/HybF